MNSFEKEIIRPFFIDGGALEPDSVGVAENRARVHDSSAAHFSGLGNGIGTEQNADP